MKLCLLLIFYNIPHQQKPRLTELQRTQCGKHANELVILLADMKTKFTQSELFLTKQCWNWLPQDHCGGRDVSYKVSGILEE